MVPHRILLTGASGFVARHLIPQLQAAFPDAALTLCGEGHTALNVADRDAVFALVRDIRPDACIHLAAISAVPDARRDPERAWRVNLMGPLALAEALRAAVPACPMVFASSAEIYGASFKSGQPLDETAAAAPMNTYAATKAAADLALGAMAAEGLRVIRLRPFNHTGPGQTPSFAVPAFAQQIARIGAGLQEPRMSVGNLDAARDFLDVRDVCTAYVACIARADTIAPGTVLNLASGVPRRIADVLADMLRLSGVQAEVTIDPARLRPSDIPLAQGDSALAHQVLAWTPSIPWETTLRDVLADWQHRTP